MKYKAGRERNPWPCTLSMKSFHSHPDNCRDAIDGIPLSDILFFVVIVQARNDGSKEFVVLPRNEIVRLAKPSRKRKTSRQSLRDSGLGRLRLVLVPVFDRLRAGLRLEPWLCESRVLGPIMFPVFKLTRLSMYLLITLAFIFCFCQKNKGLEFYASV
jgi:hypothetical protein